MTDRKSENSDAPTLPPPKPEASEEVTRAGEIPPEIMALLAAKNAGPSTPQNEAQTMPPPPALAPRPAAGKPATGPALASSMVDDDMDDGWGGAEKSATPASGPVNQQMKTPQAFEVYKPASPPQFDKMTPAIPFPPSAPNVPAAPVVAAPVAAPPRVAADFAPTSKTDPLPPQGPAIVPLDPRNVRIPKTPAVPHELAIAPPESPLVGPGIADGPASGALVPRRRFDVKFAMAAIVVVGVLAAVALWALK